ncbi:MAG TPA: 3-hydroxyacyl-CoA dehydrogenase family protein [Solirubrobacteraceae bacterium]|jgi:3-hydroxyacyl-CoA dehydrogenase|nr:3-hydroxyacyl-CoA dehydrogenase family protein [Solirubrobacteraceae bacterium]
MFVFKAAVVGAGTMGGDIAYAIADAGIPVVLMDLGPEPVDAGIARARSTWQARVDAGKLDADQVEQRVALITGASDLGGFGDADFVIEAVPERLDVKQMVFAELDAATPGHAVLASNTSALSISEIGEATARPDKVVGFHFFYPASTARLIEVVEGEYSSPETVRDAVNFAQTIRKTPIRCGEAPGFVVNRILTAAASELFRAVDQSGVSLADVDELVVGAKASVIGPFRLADLLGLDTVLHVAEHLQESYGERFHVSEAMRERVADGRLGRKSGKGFYEYDS